MQSNLNMGSVIVIEISAQAQINGERYSVSERNKINFRGAQYSPIGVYFNGPAIRLLTINLHDERSKSSKNKRILS